MNSIRRSLMLLCTLALLTVPVAAQERSKARLLIGSRVPIAVSEMTREGEDQVGPIVSYSYQNS